jgi:hypothetical protein
MVSEPTVYNTRTVYDEAGGGGGGGGDNILLLDDFSNVENNIDTPIIGESVEIPSIYTYSVQPYGIEINCIDNSIVDFPYNTVTAHDIITTFRIKTPASGASFVWIGDIVAFSVDNSNKIFFVLKDTMDYNIKYGTYNRHDHGYNWYSLASNADNFAISVHVKQDNVNSKFIFNNIELCDFTNYTVNAIYLSPRYNGKITVGSILAYK